jgi:hypothetical protein
MTVAYIQAGDDKIAFFNLLGKFGIQIDHAIFAIVFFVLGPAFTLGEFNGIDIKIDVKNVPENPCLAFKFPGI